MSDNTPIIVAPGQIQFEGGGSFVAGTKAVFFFTFTDITGQLYDPYDFSIEILDPSGTSVETGTNLDKVELGIFAYSWNIPNDEVAGNHTLNLSYTYETIDSTTTDTHTEEFIVIESGQTNGEAYTYRQVATRAFLESLIGYIQRIPIFHEPARFNKARTTCELSFPRWNQSAGVKVYLNGDVQESGYSVDYLKGRVIFGKSRSSYDETHVSYNFRWFTDSELDSFLEQGVNVVNIWPPQSVYTINTIEDRWIIAAEYAAAINVYRRWMSDVQFQEPIKIFGSLQRAQEVFGNFDTIKRNYEDQLNKMLEMKKYGPYSGLTKTVTVPEFTLPGGRCLAYNSMLVFKVNNEEIQSDTIENVYTLLENGNIQVLSDNNGELSFEQVSKIWESGSKPLLRIEDEFGNSVEVSDEHIMFINNRPAAASDVKVGDLLTITSFENIRDSKVVSITPITKTLTFDIEVPSTENLFVNNIKCHNSRWFRYLFSTN